MPMILEAGQVLVHHPLQGAHLEEARAAKPGAAG